MVSALLYCKKVAWRTGITTVYPKKYAHGFVVLCFVVVMQSFIMNSHEVFIHIHQGCFAGTGAIVRLPQCQWSKPDGCGKISQCITTTKHSKAKTVCIFLGIYCIVLSLYCVLVNEIFETEGNNFFFGMLAPWTLLSGKFDLVSFLIICVPTKLGILWIRYLRWE